MRTILVSAVVLCACGGVRSPDLTAWDAEVATARQRVTDYQGLVSTTTPAADECVRARDQYKSDLLPFLSRMRGMSDGFDGCFGAMGHGGYADVGAMCSDMEVELGRYGTAGCGSTDPLTRRADALDHCRRMLDSLDHAASRSGSMSDMMGGRMMGSPCG